MSADSNNTRYYSGTISNLSFGSNINFNSQDISDLSLEASDQIVAHLNGSKDKSVVLRFVGGALEKYLTETRRQWLPTVISLNITNKFTFIDSIWVHNSIIDYLLIDDKLRVFKTTSHRGFRLIEPLKHRKKLITKNKCASWLRYADGVLYCPRCEEVVQY